MQPVSEVTPTFEKQPAKCPSCGGDSIAIRFAPPPGLSEAMRKRLDPERPFVAQRCNACIARVEAEKTAAEERLRREEAIAGLHVPPLYADATLDSFVTRDVPALVAALKYARDFVATWPDVPMISIFTGHFGTGKGHLSWSIAKDLASTHGVRGRVVVLSDVIRDLRETWGQKNAEGPTDVERVAKYRAPNLLVIDEVSRHAFFGQPMQHLYDLVAWREVHLRPTIITTNESGEELASVLGPALSSRAIGWGGLVRFGDQDYRIMKREAAAKT